LLKQFGEDIVVTEIKDQITNEGKIVPVKHIVDIAEKR
jgi:hypothetical protein